MEINTIILIIAICSVVSAVCGYLVRIEIEKDNKKIVRQPRKLKSNY